MCLGQSPFGQQHRSQIDKDNRVILGLFIVPLFCPDAISIPYSKWLIFPNSY